MKSPIEALMRPDAIAVIGASAKPGKIGNALVRNLEKSKAKIFPVNPHEERIEGLECYRTVLDIPGEIDLAVISLPADKVFGEVKNAVDRGVPCIIIVSVGFSEMNADGRKLEHEMAAYARSKGSRILGPNTLGVFSPITGIDTLLVPSDRSPRPSRGGLGVISQSGSVQVSLLERSAARGIGVSYSVGLGNRCDITEIDMLSFLAKDEDTSASRSISNRSMTERPLWKSLGTSVAASRWSLSKQAALTQGPRQPPAIQELSPGERTRSWMAHSSSPGLSALSMTKNCSTSPTL